jgi:hypothetical protein
MEENEFKFTTGVGTGLRYNQGKLRHDLIHSKALEDMVKVLTDGANKYEPRNWQKGMSWSSLIASLKRHLIAIEKGEDYDKESGNLHIAHLACNAHFLNAFYHDFPQGDDRVKKILNLPKISLDVDGVIADFMGAWHEIYSEIPSNPSTYYCDRQMLKRFEEMKNNNSLDDFYLNIKPLIKSNDLLFEPECYITSRPINKEITEQWLDNNKFPAKPVISLNIRESKVKFAKENNVERKQKPQITENDNFFNIIDNEEKAYYLGFICADGSIASDKIKKTRLAFTINTKDKNILLKFKELIKTTAPVNDRIYIDKRNGREIHSTYLIIYSQKIINDLLKLGVGSDKTKNLNLPKINNDLIKHLIRGLVDGDGHIGKRVVSIISTKECVDDILKYLKNYNIFATKFEKFINKEKNVYMRYFYKDGLKFLNHIYSNATVFLERKYESYLQRIENYDNETIQTTTQIKILSLKDNIIFNSPKECAASINISSCHFSTKLNRNDFVGIYKKIEKNIIILKRNGERIIKTFPIEN